MTNLTFVVLSPNSGWSIGKGFGCFENEESSRQEDSTETFFRFLQNSRQKTNDEQKTNKLGSLTMNSQPLQTMQNVQTEIPQTPEAIPLKHKGQKG